MFWFLTFQLIFRICMHLFFLMKYLIMTRNNCWEFFLFYMMVSILKTFIDFYSNMPQNPQSHMKFKFYIHKTTPCSYINYLKTLLIRVNQTFYQLDWLNMHSTVFQMQSMPSGTPSSLTVIARQNYFYKNIFLEMTVMAIYNKTHLPVWNLQNGFHLYT